MIQTRDWILSNEAPKLIHLLGERRLSACVALGFAFSATRGFVIHIENRGEYLRTDHFPDAETPEYYWQIENPEDNQSEEIAIIVSIKREIFKDVHKYNSGSFPIALSMHSTDSIVDAKQINLAIEKVKGEIASVLSKTGAKIIHLFLAVPSPFAVFLGHRLNATSIIQAYEHTGGSSYTPTIRFNFT